MPPTKQLKHQLLQEGREHGNAYPWHETTDPFRVLLAEYLLRRTTRKVVSRVYIRILDSYPTPEALSEASRTDLWSIAKEAGLKERTLALIGLAKEIAADGGLEPDPQSLQEIHGVGPYISDAVLLYAFSERRFPLDSSVQRVLCRTFFGDTPKARQDPYRNEQLREAVAELTRSTPPNEYRLIHQGLLHIAWAYCRARPQCAQCPLAAHCAYNRSRETEPAEGREKNG